MNTFEGVTEVYVRVDAASRRVIGVSPIKLVTRAGRPVFKVTANFKRLDYYVVEPNVSATYGFTVRAANTAEQTAADDLQTQRLAETKAKAKSAKSIEIKDFFDRIFIGRFHTRGFFSTTETLAAAEYTGTDTHMTTVVKPLAQKINQAYNEWRHVVCQPVIDAMLAAEDMGVELNDEYRTTIQDELDTFLTARDFDVAVYAR